VAARKASPRRRAGPGRRALLLVDFINFFDFPGSAKLERRARIAARNVARLKARLARARVPCIYANDNFGQWKSEFARLVDECLAKGGASAEIAELLKPGPGDYSVLKPRHSAFFGTPLEFLLEELGAESLVITGLSADNCVFATAQDAYVRKFSLWVPADCVAADTSEHERQALDHLKRTMKADIRPSPRRA
jgi:nicotinamidase-related amidase